LLEIILSGERLVLLPQKAIYWPAYRCLLISDVHLGKVQHFRKAGIAVPLQAGEENYNRLHKLLATYEVERLLFLGDLFHSKLNDDWQQFCDFVQDYRHISIELIRGNHDILIEDQFKKACDIVHPEGLILGPYFLSHHPTAKAGFYNLSGHIHPAIKLRSPSRMSIRLSCFHFGEQIGILPAFGSFTGMATVSKKKNDRVYAIADDQVIEI
jgi:DNA ligase-associated metallophosphoesterase